MVLEILSLVLFDFFPWLPVDSYFSDTSLLDDKTYFLSEKLIFIKFEFPLIFIYF